MREHVNNVSGELRQHCGGHDEAFSQHARQDRRLCSTMIFVLISIPYCLFVVI